MTIGGHRPGAARGLLGLVLLVALGVRLWGLRFGLPHVLARPDELFIFGVVNGLLRGDPNPHMFDYPGLFLYLVAGLFMLYYSWGLAAGRFTNIADLLEAFRVNWEPFFLMTRGLTALLGTATAGLAHAIAAPLFGATTGVLSALFVALAFLHVRDSHYATTDVPMTFFIMCTMLAVVRVYRTRSARDAWLGGLMSGLATGIKYNAAPVVLALVAVEVVHAWGARGDWRRALRETHLWRMGLASAAVFLATSPYLVLDFTEAHRQLVSLAGQASAGMTPPEMLGNGWSYHLPFSLRYGMGLPLLVASLVGMALMAVRDTRLALILGIFPVTYYVVAGAGYNVFVRYMVPIVPMLCIFAAYAVSALAERAAPRVRLGQPATAAVLAVLIVLPSATSVVRFDHLLAQEDSRVVAARWFIEQAPAGSSVHMTGNLYGQPQIEPPDGKYRRFMYDRRAKRFLWRQRANGRVTETPVAGPPDYIIVQTSAIPYSHIELDVLELVRAQYRLVHVVRAADLSVTSNFYDIQDGFYAPFAGFEGVRRPGPNLEIYELRNRPSPLTSDF